MSAVMRPLHITGVFGVHLDNLPNWIPENAEAQQCYGRDLDIRSKNLPWLEGQVFFSRKMVAWFMGCELYIYIQYILFNQVECGWCFWCMFFSSLIEIHHMKLKQYAYIILSYHLRRFCRDSTRTSSIFQLCFFNITFQTNLKLAFDYWDKFLTQSVMGYANYSPDSMGSFFPKLFMFKD